VAQCKEHMMASHSYAESVRWADQVFGRQLIESLLVFSLLLCNFVFKF